MEKTKFSQYVTTPMLLSEFFEYVISAMQCFKSIFQFPKAIVEVISGTDK